MPFTAARTGRSDVAEVVAALAAWTPATWAGQLHPGDVGWQLRFEDDLVDGSLLLVRGGAGELVAVGLLDGPDMVRLAVAPDRAHDPHLAARLADEVEAALADGEAYVDGAPLAGWRAALADRGWAADPDPWVALHRTLDGVGTALPSGVGPLLGDADVADRVAVQRSAFEGSTFTVARWALMAAGPTYDASLDLLGRDEAGAPVAAGTAWSAGAGRCGLLEPVGTSRDHQGRGHGNRLLDGLCAALAATGASGVAVATPGSNSAALRAYSRAGFRSLGPLTSMRRPG